MLKPPLPSGPGPHVTGVTLRRVGRVFDSTVALRGVCGAFDPGCVHLILGENGSGKTTLLRVISTMLSPSFGTVEYRGVPASDVRGTLGWVSHSLLVYSDLSGEENLRLAAGLYGMDESLGLQFAIEQFQLGRWVSRPVQTMSRGQRQRVALARALIHRPSLVLLDEPTTGLDADGVAALLLVLRREVEVGHE